MLRDLPLAADLDRALTAADARRAWTFEGQRIGDVRVTCVAEQDPVDRDPNRASRLRLPPLEVGQNGS